MGLAHAGMAQHGTAVFAHEQVRGKGQRNRQWLSERGQNIALSVVLSPPAGLSGQPFALSAAVACAARTFLSRYAGEDVTIKWPNDIYWRDRKAAGILIENLWQGNQWKTAVAGLGVNVNQSDFGSLAGRAVSIFQITGERMDPVTLARELCRDLEEQYVQVTGDPAATFAEYHRFLYLRGQRHRFRQGSRVFEAVVQEVTAAGELVLQHAVEERFEVGAIEWL